MLVILTGSVATVAVGFAKYFSYFVPALSTTNQVIAVPMPWGAWSISAGQIVAALSILALGAVNYVGVKSGNLLQATLTVLKIIALVALPIVALALHPVALSFTPLAPPIASPAAAFGVVMIAVMWAYEGWYYLPFCAGEIKDPRRTVPLALVIGIVTLVLIYLTVNLLHARAAQRDSGRRAHCRESRHRADYASGARIVAATVVVSTLGCNADWRRGRATRWRPTGCSLAAAASQFRTPHVAIAITCAWAALLTLTGHEQLFTCDVRVGTSASSAGSRSSVCESLPNAPSAPDVATPSCRRFLWPARRARRQHRRRKTGRVAHRRDSGRARPAGLRLLALEALPPADVNGRIATRKSPDPWARRALPESHRWRRVIAWHTPERT
jgi:APA family basic amino acid/polyamine antiporter